MQVPPPTMVTVVPETVQVEEVADVKVTVSPDDALAERAKGESPKVLLASEANEIV